jgi:GxxExxY protein
MTDIAALNELTNDIIAAAITVHRKYGPGLLESVYHLSLAMLLVEAGHVVEVGKAITVEWKEFKTDCAYRMDLVVDDQVIVEVKSVDALTDLHRAQMLTYLTLTGYRVGLLINFNVQILKDGIRRVVNDLRDSEGQRA